MIQGILEAISRKRDVNGNTYWACSYRDTATGRVFHAQDLGGESNCMATLYAMHGADRAGFDWSQWHYTTRELPAREYDRLTKAWPYAGNSGEEFARVIRAELEKGGEQ